MEDSSTASTELVGWLLTDVPPSTHSGANALLPVSYYVTFMVLRIVLCGLAVVTNSLTTAVLVTFPFLRTGVIYIFILNLCFSDTLLGVSFGMHNTIRIMVHLGFHREYFGLLSRIVATFVMLGNMASLMGTALIGVDRAIATTSPLTYKNRMTSQVARLLVCGSWLYLMTVTFTFSGLKYLSLSEVDKHHVVFTMEEVYSPEAHRFLFAPQTVIITLGTVILYAKILTKVNSQKKKVQVNSKKSEKMTKMILVLLTVMLAAWLPNNFITLFKLPPAEENPTGHIVYIVVYNILIVVNCVPFFSNAFIYAGQHRDYRKAYSTVMQCGLLKANVHPETTASTNN